MNLELKTKKRIMLRMFIVQCSMFIVKSKPPRGFTLIEILVTAGIYAVIGTLVLSVIFIAVRGSRASDMLAVIQQNGSSTLSQMERQMRYAKTLDDPASCVTPVTTSSITVTGLDDVQKSFRCPSAMSPLSDITVNGVPLTDTTAVAVNACFFRCSQKTIVDPPTIDIQFTLTTKEENIFTGSNVTVPFQTSVIMRNAAR